MGADKGQCRRYICALRPQRDVLSRLTVGRSGVSVVKGQARDARGGEMLFVLRKHHLVRRPETVRQHDRRVWPLTYGQGEPGRASDTARLKIDAMSRDG
jgi:hypothetical protein